MAQDLEENHKRKKNYEVKPPAKNPMKLGCRREIQRKFDAVIPIIQRSSIGKN
jgi:hypothetical protein